MKNLFIYLCFLISSIACNNREEPAVNAMEKKVYNFDYANSYKIHDIVLFKGPKGMEENPKEEVIQKTWTNYSKPEYNSVQIDLENKSIRLNLGSSFIKKEIEFSNDSIYISSEKKFIGIFDRKNETFKLFKSFSYIKKNLPNQGLSFNRFTALGKINFTDIFGINTFNNPSEMTNMNDEVFWANLSFTYK